MRQASINCLLLLRHLMPCALVFDLASAGSSIEARMAMMAMTTSNSINVNPVELSPMGPESFNSLRFADGIVDFRSRSFLCLFIVSSVSFYANAGQKQVGLSPADT